MSSPNSTPDAPMLTAPLLKTGVLHAQVEDGTYIELGERNFLVRDDKLFPVVSRLLSCFDGERPADAIRASLPPKLAPLFDRLFDSLVRHRMLSSGPKQAFPADHPHAATLHFFREATSRWREAFEDWTQARIVLAGSPETLPALARALASAGAGPLSIVAADAADAASAAETRERLRAQVPPDCAVLDRATALRLPKTPRSLLLHLDIASPPDAPASDAAMSDVAASEIEALARSHEVVIAGTVRGGLGIVGPDWGADPAPWRALSARLPASGPPFTRAAIRVLASLLAFEAMQERIALRSDDPDEHARRRSQFRLVRNDGSVSSHDLDVFLASGRSLEAAASEASPDTRPDPQTMRFFDPATGPFRDAGVPGPEYPLAHRAVALIAPRPGDDDGQDVLCAWGLDPASAERRLMLDAFATLATRGTGHAPAPGRSPLVAAASADEARAQAMALALATHPGFLLTHPPRAYAVSADDAADVQVLLRLIHLYAGALPLVRCAGDASAGACIAWVDIDDRTAVAVAPDLATALAEALGEALSGFQLGRPTDRQARWPWSSLRAASASASAAVDCAAVDCAAVMRDYIEVRPPWLPSDVHLCHAQVRGA
jgi:hypothetical protein